MVVNRHSRDRSEAEKAWSSTKQCPAISALRQHLFGHHAASGTRNRDGLSELLAALEADSHLGKSPEGLTATLGSAFCLTRVSAEMLPGDAFWGGFLSPGVCFPFLAGLFILASFHATALSCSCISGCITGKSQKMLL